MFGFIKKWILKERTNKRQPQVGDVYSLNPSDPDNPFKNDHVSYVTVKEVKSGYVLYTMGDNSIFQNESFSVVRFLNIYSYHPNLKQTGEEKS